MDELRLPDDLKECVAFHGHLCPGLVIGYCAAKLGMRKLNARRAGDEELIAIVENDTCAVDAVQVLTGCTFGKGNLFFRDHGKMVFTFATRASGRSARLCLRPPRPANDSEVSEEERRQRGIEFMLSQDPSDLFETKGGALGEFPETARLRQSLPCDGCGEMVMSTRIRSRAGRNLCVPCAAGGQEERGAR